MGFDGDMSVEDLIPEEEMVVTVTARRLHQAHPQRQATARSTAAARA